MEIGAWKSPALAGALLAWTAMPAAIAGDYDGSKPLICAGLEATSCQADGACKPGTVDSLNIPQFFWVDVVGKTVGEKGTDGQIRTSPIQTTTQSTTHLVLQGTTDRLGWSAAISKASGKLTVTGTDGAYALVIFGSCTPTK
jgi:hypothetical protein